jgi:hypothetical protein
MCLAEAGRSKEHNIAGFVNKPQRSQLADLALIDGRPETEVKLVKRFHERQVCQLEPRSQITCGRALTSQLSSSSKNSP